MEKMSQSINLSWIRQRLRDDANKAPPGDAQESWAVDEDSISQLELA